jgi:hypothetical protein
VPPSTMRRPECVSTALQRVFFTPK